MELAEGGSGGGGKGDGSKEPAGSGGNVAKKGYTEAEAVKKVRCYNCRP